MRLSLFFIFSCPIASSSLLASSSSPPTSSSSLTLSASRPPPSCLAADGSRVDWWFALKHPGGDRYSYLDSEEAEGGERLEEGGLASATEGPLARTLLQLYRPPPGLPAPLPWHVLWNDQPPPSHSHEDETGPSFYFAHSKGVLAIDDDGENGGFFLSHSAPCFPNDPGQGSSGYYSGLLRPQRRFSQHFLCVSLGSSGMENLTRHLARAFRPRAFSVALPARGRRSRSLEAAAAFAAGELPLAPTSSAEVRTAKGKELLLLLATAGGPSSPPLWDSVVASALADASVAASSSSSGAAAPRPRLPLLPQLAVQSWIRTEGAAPPKCRMPPLSGDASEFSPLLLPSVLGIRRVSFGRNSSSGSSWSSEEAHAKFGVALGEDDDDDPILSNFTCVGDTNRDAPWRAGGAACVRWPGLRRLLASGVDEVDACADERAGE